MIYCVADFQGKDVYFALETMYSEIPDELMVCEDRNCEIVEIKVSSSDLKNIREDR